MQKARPYIWSLTNLRRVQRPDKNAGKSGKKTARPGDIREFPLLPVYGVNDDETVEEMQMAIGSTEGQEGNSGNHYDETIQSVIDEGVRLSQEIPEVPSHPTSSSFPAMMASASRLLDLISEPTLPTSTFQAPAARPTPLPSALQPSAARPTVLPSTFQTSAARPTPLPSTAKPSAARATVLPSTFQSSAAYHGFSSRTDGLTN